MNMITNEHRCIEEAYSSATTSSNLRCETRDDAPRCDTDLLIAAGWSRSRLGSALLRLHTEFDRCARPIAPTRGAIEALALTMPMTMLTEGGSGRLVHSRANAKRWATKIAWEWHATELRTLVGRLTTLPMVREQLTQKARMEAMEDPARIAIQVIAWWLHQTCRVCNGTMEQEVRGTGRLSGQACRECHGSGKSCTPGGSAGRRLANVMDDAVEAARDSIRQHLRLRR
jgi:hypothetical protein